MIPARRTFLAQAMAAAGLLTLRLPSALSASTVTVIDNVTALYSVRVAAVASPHTTSELVAEVMRWQGKIAVGGGRYSMGGQIGITGSLHIDMRGMNKLVKLDAPAQTARVQAGMRWRDLQEIIDPQGLAL